MGRKIKTQTVWQSDGFTQFLLCGAKLPSSSHGQMTHRTLLCDWLGTQRYTSLTQPHRKWFPLWMQCHHSAGRLMTRTYATEQSRVVRPNQLAAQAALKAFGVFLTFKITLPVCEVFDAQHRVRRWAERNKQVGGSCK